MFLLGTLLSANAQVPGYVPSNGLVCWFPFNGNANDESGNGKNGVVNGATLTSDRFGKINSAYNFSGTTNDITLSNSQNLVNTSFTVSAWGTLDNLTPTEADAVVIGQFNGQNTGDRKWLFGYRATGNQKGITYYLFDNLGNCPNNSFSTNWTPQTAEWYNVTWVFNSGNSIKTYINGVLHTTLSTTLTSFNSTSNNILTKIGNGISANTPRNIPWNGKLDDIGIWNRALTQNEIEKLYSGCSKSITQQPTNQGMFNGNATFTCATDDTLVNYQWQTNSGTGWNNLFDAGQYSGSNTNSLQVSNITSSNNNQLFRCIIKGGCLTDTTSEVSLRVWGLGVQSEQVQAFKVYPNPTKGQVTIENGDIAKMIGYTVSIYNVLGQQLFQSNINQQQFSIDISKLGGNGLYFMELTDNNGNILDVKKIALK